MNGMTMLNDALKGLAEHIDAYDKAAKSRIARTGKLARTPSDRKADVLRGKIKQMKAKAPGGKVVPFRRPPPTPPAQAAGRTQRLAASIEGDDLMKALSDADTVLGHTGSGKPVKVHGKYHGRFSADDHEDAADVHGDLAERFSRLASRYSQDKSPPAARRAFEHHAKHHRIMAARHRQEREKQINAQNKEKGSLIGESPSMANDKSPLFDKSTLVADLSKAIKGAVSKSVAAMRYERSMTCPIHANGQASVAAGIAGSRVDLRATHCRCNDLFAKSAVAERTMDALRAQAETLAVAKELGIPLSVEWVEHALGTDNEE